MAKRPRGLNTTRALVLGGAQGVWDEVASVEQMIGHPWDGLVVACNEAGAHWPRELHHWATFHQEKFPEWEELRRTLGHPPGYVRWARRQIGLYADRRIHPWGGGSSGLLAVAVAYELECRKIICCGIPMELRPHFHTRDAGRPWAHSDSMWGRWVDSAEKLKERTRSMSGRTRDLLGPPTHTWLETFE